MAGSTVAGSTVAGSTVAGSTVAGSTVAGSTVAGSTVGGSTVAGATMAESTAAEPADRHWRLRHLPAVLAVSAALLVVAAGIGGLAAGGTGAAGAMAGVGLVTVSYLSSTLVIAWADSVHPALVLPFGVAMYVAKFSVIGVVMAGVADSGWAGLGPLGFGVIAGVIAWTGTNIWWISTVHLARMRQGTGG